MNPKKEINTKKEIARFFWLLLGLILAIPARIADLIELLLIVMRWPEQLHEAIERKAKSIGKPKPFGAIVSRVFRRHKPTAEQVN